MSPADKMRHGSQPLDHDTTACLPPIYRPATARNVTPAERIRGVIGLGFETQDGSIHLALSIADAEFIAQALVRETNSYRVLHSSRWRSKWN